MRLIDADALLSDREVYERCRRAIWLNQSRILKFRWCYPNRWGRTQYKDKIDFDIEKSPNM